MKEKAKRKKTNRNKRTEIKKPEFGKMLAKRLTAWCVTAAVIGAAALTASVLIYNSYMYEQTENRVANMSGIVRDIMWDENEPRENMLGDITYRLVWQAEYVDGEEPYIAWKLLEDETGRPVSDCKQLLFFICSDSKERKETAYLCHPDVCDKVAEKIREYEERSNVTFEGGSTDGREYMIRGDEAYIDGGYFYPKIGLYSMDEKTYYSTVGTEDVWDSWEEEEVTDFYPADTTGMKLIKNDRTDDSANCYFLAYNSGSIFDKETCEAVDKLAEKYPSLSEDEKNHYSDGDWEYEGARIYTGYSSLEEADGEYTDYVLLCAVRYSFFDSFGVIAFPVIGGLILLAAAAAFFTARIAYADRKAQYDIFDERRKMTRAMAHDLRTPLTSLSGYAELLQSGASPEKQEHYLEMIVKNVGQMDRIVGDILELSKAESKTAPPKPEDTDLAELCRRVTEDLGGAFAQNGLRCRCSIPAGTVIYADRRLLTQALTNLLHNAAVYSKRGTSVDITMSGKILSIENTPEVMPEKPAEELMKPFVKDSAWRGADAGSGVGLSIARQDLERMGYKLEIIIREGKFRAECRF